MGDQNFGFDYVFLFLGSNRSFISGGIMFKKTSTVLCALGLLLAISCATKSTKVFVHTNYMTGDAEFAVAKALTAEFKNRGINACELSAEKSQQLAEHFKQRSDPATAVQAGIFRKDDMMVGLYMQQVDGQIHIMLIMYDFETMKPVAFIPGFWEKDSMTEYELAVFVQATSDVVEDVLKQRAQNQQE